MRGERFSPIRLVGTYGSLLCPAQRLRDRLPVASVVASLLWGASRPTAPHERLRSAQYYDGDLDRGQSQGQTRVITGLSVTNHGAVAVNVSVEEEADHDNNFSATVQPGQTLAVTVLPIVQTWNTTGIEGFAGRWAGLNIRFGEV